MPTVSSQAFELLVVDVSDDDDEDDEDDITSVSVATGCDIEIEGEERCNKIEPELASSKIGSAACPELLRNCCTLTL